MYIMLVFVNEFDEKSKEELNCNKNQSLVAVG